MTLSNVQDDGWGCVKCIVGSYRCTLCVSVCVFVCVCAVLPGGDLLQVVDPLWQHHLGQLRGAPLQPRAHPRHMWIRQQLLLCEFPTAGCVCAARRNRPRVCNWRSELRGRRRIFVTGEACAKEGGNSSLNYGCQSINQSVARNDGEETERRRETDRVRIKYRSCENEPKLSDGCAGLKSRHIRQQRPGGGGGSQRAESQNGRETIAMRRKVSSECFNTEPLVCLPLSCLLSLARHPCRRCPIRSVALRASMMTTR